jgi:hypothetical protein
MPQVKEKAVSQIYKVILFKANLFLSQTTGKLACHMMTNSDKWMN